MLYGLLRPLLFRGDPEQTHERVLATVDGLSSIKGFNSLSEQIFRWESPLLETQLWDRVLPNPVGLAAGFDKNGRIIDPLFSLGFGLVEVGTVTPFPQPGNEIPRLFRLPEDRSLINRLGFNNDGLNSLIEKLQSRKSHGVLGINIGKNKNTSLEHAGEDYLKGLSATHAWADYFCINISSPNTEDLRQLQEGDQLSRLLEKLCSQREMLDHEAGKKTPLLIKLAPDWEQEALKKSIERIKTFPLDGVVATNTTLSREGLTSPLSRESGGLSGKPLLKSSNKVIKTLYRGIGAKIPIIGVGGIFTAEDAYAKIKAGASAVQVYTELVYQGPGMVRELKKGLVRLLRQDGLPNITAAIGLDEKTAV